MKFLAHITGPTYRKTGKCFHLDVEISEAEKARYGKLPGLNERWCEVDFRVLSDAEAAEAALQQPRTSDPDFVSPDQMKLLHVMFGKQKIIEWYHKSFAERYGEVKTKEDCKRVFKAMLGIESIKDLPREAANEALDKMTKFVEKEEATNG